MGVVLQYDTVDVLLPDATMYAVVQCLSVVVYV